MLEKETWLTEIIDVISTFLIVPLILTSVSPPTTSIENSHLHVMNEYNVIPNVDGYLQHCITSLIVTRFIESHNVGERCNLVPFGIVDMQLLHVRCGDGISTQTTQE